VVKADQIYSILVVIFHVSDFTHFVQLFRWIYYIDFTTGDTQFEREMTSYTGGCGMCRWYIH